MKAINVAVFLFSMVMVSSSVYSGENDHPSNNLKFKAELSGSEEVPPVSSETSGITRFRTDRNGNLVFDLKIKGGVGILGAAGAHIHCATAGNNGPVVAFLAGQTTPGFDGDISIQATLTDASIINPTCGADIAELVEAMEDGMTYVNVHSINNPGGEVRGQIYPAD